MGKRILSKEDIHAIYETKIERAVTSDVITKDNSRIVHKKQLVFYWYDGKQGWIVRYTDGDHQEQTFLTLESAVEYYNEL